MLPPVNVTRVLVPLREPAPLWPRPAVLPWPEPMPRPIRLRFLFFVDAAIDVAEIHDRSLTSCRICILPDCATTGDSAQPLDVDLRPQLLAGPPSSP